MKIKLVPDFYFIILLLLTIAFHFIFPIIKFVFPPFNLIGIFIIFFGIILTLWTNFILILKQTSIKPYKIPSFFVSFGPFKYSRNPIYLGMVLILFGVDVLLGTLVTLIFTIIFIMILSKFVIPIEEKYLKIKFGKKYLNYKKRVRKWI